MSSTEPLTLCCQLWATPGHEADLSAYEDAVLALLVDHGAQILQRAVSDGGGGVPHEVQFFRFPSQVHLDGYLTDDRRTAMADERRRVVARTELFPVVLR